MIFSKVTQKDKGQQSIELDPDPRDPAGSKMSGLGWNLNLARSENPGSGGPLHLCVMISHAS